MKAISSFSSQHQHRSKGAKHLSVLNVEGKHISKRYQFPLVLCAKQWVTLNPDATLRRVVTLKTS